MVATAFGVEATVVFTEGNDFTLVGTTGDDVIAALGGDDIISGLTGTDMIDGGAGYDMAVMQTTFDNSVLEIDSAGRLVISSLAGQSQAYRHTLANVERVQFQGADERDLNSLIILAGGTPIPAGQTITGTDGPDIIPGASGDDLIRPLFGSDFVRGGPGDDTLELLTTLENTSIFVATPTELAFRGSVGAQSFAYTVAEIELFRFADGATYTLAQMVALADNNPGAPVEEPTGGDDILVGTSGADFINGLGGNDTLRGFGGGDKLKGAAGNDKLFGGAGSDVLIGGRGSDLLKGGGGADTLKGGGGNDTLKGGGGNDLLKGGAGNDRMFGNRGSDVLEGGKGKDVMTGGRGADDFVFNDRHTGRSEAKRDVITDFGGRDKIDLSRVDADSGVGGDQDFSFAGTSASAHSVWYSVSGGDAIVFGDTNGDNSADFAIELTGVTSLSANDFIL